MLHCQKDFHLAKRVQSEKDEKCIDYNKNMVYNEVIFNKFPQVSIFYPFYFIKQLKKTNSIYFFNI